MDLAKAIDQGFYDFYKNWTKVKGARASSKEKVNSLVLNKKTSSSANSGRSVGGELAIASCGPCNSKGSR